MSKTTQENFPKLKANELIEELMFTVTMQEETGKSVPMMVWGQPGAGKSDIVKAVGALTGRPIIDIRLLLKDPTDLSGIPFINSDGEMGFAPPADLPVSDMKADELRVHLAELKEELESRGISEELLKSMSDKELATLAVLQNKIKSLMNRLDMTRAIILLDELSSAPPSLQAAALQLVLDRMVGTYLLPKDVVIFGAGNRASDKTEHYEMPMPLRNRLRHVELVIDSEQWIKWAISEKVHPSIVGLIKVKPTLLNRFPDALKFMQYAFATPRTWKQASDVLYFSENKKANSKIIHSRMSSIIGSGTASEFISHLKYVHRLASPESIATGKTTAWDSSLDMSAAYTMIINTLYWVDTQYKMNVQEHDNKAIEILELHLDNTMKFMLDNFEDSPELCVLTMHMSFSTFKLPYQGVQFDVLIDKFGDFIDL